MEFWTIYIREKKKKNRVPHLISLLSAIKVFTVLFNFVYQPFDKELNKNPKKKCYPMQIHFRRHNGKKERKMNANLILDPLHKLLTKAHNISWRESYWETIQKDFSFMLFGILLLLEFFLHHLFDKWPETETTDRLVICSLFVSKREQ